MSRTKVLVLVADAGLRERLKMLTVLEDEFAIEETKSAQVALKLALEDRFDVMLLDVEGSEMGGHLLCRLLRSRGVACPIIMLSRLESDAEVVLGFESGASDFVSGPLNMKTFVARLRAHAHRFEREEIAAFKIGHFLFQSGNNSLTDGRNDNRVHLTRKEAMVLRHLCRHRGSPVHRDDLLRKVWGWDPTTFTHTLESHVHRLRKKLEPDPRCPIFILTSNCGYQLAGAECIASGLSARNLLARRERERRNKQ